MGEYKSDAHLPSFRWYGCILYPDEDIRHKKALDFITTCHLQFPKYLYIYHEAEFDIRKKVDNNMPYKEITPDEAEKLFKDKENDKFAEDIEPNRVICKPHVHMCFKFPKPYTYNTALRTFMCVDEDFNDALLIKYLEPIHYTEKYFTYMLHQDIKSIELGKKLYSYKEMHGDTSLITKLVVDNGSFVQLCQIEFAKFISMNPKVDSVYSFNQCISYLARADPVKYNLLSQFYRQNKGLVDGVLKDISIYKKYKLEFDEEYIPSEKYLNSKIEVL